ncbi:MAG: hypothetical protein A3J94_14430 [Syntrophus sp. RIFOXYC2_FULL_54_9]|nr:MAG: hypothetical protein A3J94_14430 [Syntrophus sp. RIFOXYC2_FULL_54_9]
MKKLVMVAVLLMMASPAFAKKSCEELKSEIDAKIKAKGVKSYSVEIVPNDDVKDGKVIGTCDGGTKKIVYKRGE